LAAKFLANTKPGTQESRVYNFIYSDVDESPDVLDKLLKNMVGAKGFACPEPAEGNLRPPGSS
jgi:hypothetical protein